MSTTLQLSLAFGPNPRSEPVLDGAVQAEGIEFACSRVPAGELFHRQLTHQEFDVSEMSISTLLIITAQGDTNWVASPESSRLASSSGRWPSRGTARASTGPRT